ncbi:MAG: hypothetical protein ACMXYG_05205 [Candidatus Woesearchaeota archaeon]
MDLGDKVKKIWDKARLQFFVPSTKIGIKNHLLDQLNSYFEGKDSESQKNYLSILESNVDESFAKYEKSFNSTISQIGTGIGGTTALWEIATHATRLNASFFPNVALTIMAGKTSLELPHIYHYMKNAKDINGIYGLALYGLKKAFGLAVPIIGPALEGSSLRDMLASRISYEAKKNFLIKIGAYENLYDRIKSHIENVAGKLKNSNLYLPNLQPV